MGTKNPIKTHKFIFSPKWWQKLLPVAVFGHILVFHCRLGHTVDLVILAKSQKIFTGTFWDIWSQSWKIQRLFLKVTRNSHLPIFDILQPLYPSSSVPIFRKFKFVKNFLQWSAFFGLSQFLALFLPFYVRLYNSKTKQGARWTITSYYNFFPSI